MKKWKIMPSIEKIIRTPILPSGAPVFEPVVNKFDQWIPVTKKKKIIIITENDTKKTTTELKFINLNIHTFTFIVRKFCKNFFQYEIRRKNSSVQENSFNCISTHENCQDIHKSCDHKSHEYPVWCYNIIRSESMCFVIKKKKFGMLPDIRFQK